MEKIKKRKPYLLFYITFILILILVPLAASVVYPKCDCPVGSYSRKELVSSYYSTSPNGDILYCKEYNNYICAKEKCSNPKRQSEDPYVEPVNDGVEKFSGATEECILVSLITLSGGV